VIDGRLDDFATQTRLMEFALGLLDMGRRIEAACSVPRSDGQSNAKGPLVDVLLGAISTYRTLQAVITAQPRGDDLRRDAPTTTAPAPHTLSLR
jgi:hypothetical protein